MTLSSENRRERRKLWVIPLRDALLTAVFLMGAFAFSAWWIYSRSHQVQFAHLQSDAIKLAKAAAETVDLALHEKLQAHSHAGSEFHRECVSPLLELKAALSNVAEFYTMRFDADRTVIVLDTRDTPNTLEVGHHKNSNFLRVMDEPPEDMREVFAELLAGREVASPQLIRKKGQLFLSGYAPLRNKLNQVVGAVGVEMDADNFPVRIATVRSAAISSIQLGAVFSFLVGGVVFFLRRHGLEGRMVLDEAANREKLIHDALGEAVYEYHAGKGRILWSGQVERFLPGTPPGSLEELLRRVHPDDVNVVRKEYSGDHPPGEAYSLEYRLITPEGGELWVLDRGLCSQKENGACVVRYGALLNVSQTKETLSALRDSENRFRDVSEAAGEYLWETNLEGHFTYLSPRVKDVLGYEPEEMLGRSPFDFVLEEDRQSAVERSNQIVQACNPFHGIEHRNVRKDGRVIWLQVNGLPVFDAAGGLIGYRGAGMDITARKNAEQALIQSEQRYRLVIDQLRDIVIQTDPSGEITYVNPAWRRVTRREAREIEGQRLDKIFVRHDRAGIEEALKLLSTCKIECFTIEAHCEDSEGNVRLFDCFLRACFSPEGEFQGVYATLTDITQRRAYERGIVEAKEAAEAADKAKSEFLAVMSHEIRTPLNSVIGFTDLLLDMRLDPSKREYVEIIKKSGQSLLAQLNDMLDLSRIESGKFVISPVEADLRDLVEDVVDTYSNAAQQKGIALVAIFKAGVPWEVVMDSLRVRQILVNLIGNAVKFTSSGSVTVRVDFSPGKEGGGRLGFNVCDTGVGIPPDKVENLFRPFSQVDSSTTRRYGGTGLGLVISRRLAVMMGGDVWIKETSPQGTCIRAEILVESCGGGPGEDLKGIACRLAVPDPLIRESVRNLLEERGADVADVEGNISTSDRNILIVDESYQPDVVEECLSQGALLVKLVSRLPDVMETEKGMEYVRKPVRSDSLARALIRLHGKITGHRLNIAQTKKENYQPTKPGFRLLVVEDNPINLKLTLRMLENFGLTAEAAETGAVALEKIRKNDYDFIFMDVQMPGMDGLQTTREIRLEERKMGRQPSLIVALTAEAMVGDRERCMQAGMNDYVVKPLTSVLMASVLERHGLVRRMK